MHFVTVFFLAATVVSTSASLVARQSLPNCAAACLANANLNGCIQSDTHCLCTNQAFVSSTTGCITAACSGADLQNALSFSQALCAAVGVTLTTSGTAAAPSSTAASPATTTASSSTSTTSSNAAVAAHGANAFVGLAAVGLVALAL